MIPLRDHTPPQSFPLVTYALITVNVLVFLYMVNLTEPAAETFVRQYALIPREVSRGTDLFTFVTSMFLHGGFGHIIGNMLFLHIFGDNLEDALGKIRFLLFYLIAGIGGSLLQVMVQPGVTIPNLGASGAISGIMAGYLILFPTHRVDMLFTFGYFLRRATVPAYTMIFYWFAIQFISGLGSLPALADATGGVAYFAHIGGFLTGLVLIFLMPRKRYIT